MGFRCFVHSRHDIRKDVSKHFLVLLKCHTCNLQTYSCLFLVCGDDDDGQWIFFLL